MESPFSAVRLRANEGCLRGENVQGWYRSEDENRTDKESRLNLFTHLLTRPRYDKLYNTARHTENSALHVAKLSRTSRSTLPFARLIPKHQFR